MNTTAFQNRFARPALFAAFLVSALVAGCGGGGGDGVGAVPPVVPPVAPAAAAVVPGIAGSPGASATNPTVVSSSPSNGATNVASSTNGAGNLVTPKTLTVTFSEAMDPATLNSSPAGTLSTFTLKVTGGANVPGTVAMSAANTIATFTPTSALAANTDFTATITTAAKNAGGTAMPNPIVWTFKTNAVARVAQAPLNLGRAGTFAIFTNTAVTSAGAGSNVQGNVGTNGGGAGTTIACPEVTPLGVSFVFTNDAGYAGGAICNPAAPAQDGVFTLATAGDMAAAIGDAKARVVPDFVNTPGAGNLSGQVLAPGLYQFTGAGGVLIDNTGVTLAGGPDDVWIFQITGDLTVQNNAIITLGPTVQAKNIFWQVGGGAGAIIGSAVQFKGIVLADFGISLTPGSTVLGRLFANTLVALSTSTITPPAP